MLDRSTLNELNATAPSWWADLRTRAFDYAGKLEMPSEREEVWRYIDLDFDLADFGVSSGPGEPEDTGDSFAASLSEEIAARAVLVDGYTTSIEESSTAGLHVASLAEVAASEEVTRVIEAGVPPDLDVFSAVHHAMLADGVVITLEPNTILDQPVLVEVRAANEGLLSVPHIAVDVGENAELSVVIVCESSDGRFLVIPQLDVASGAGARCRVTTVQAWGAGTRSIAHQRVRLEDDASGVVSEAGLGSKLSRLHLTVDLNGRGSTAQVLGLYFGEADQVLDYRAFINHVGRSTTSDMFLKGAVEDEATSVFTGLIKIWEDAAGTSAFQTNRNLVLSDGATAQSVPNLEILCDDVMCGHGSTSGPLEPEHLYYLASRGLPKPRAERLLVRGFFDEVLRRLPVPALVDPIRSEVTRKFVDAQRQGRV